MAEGVDEDLEMSAESSISDDLRKALLQLGAALVWQSVILKVLRNTEGSESYPLHTWSASSSLALGVLASQLGPRQLRMTLQVQVH
ncbi:hypothetical protein PHET_03057 [Paragonimus heterotremus]|uniref:Uncharacterized protein n=1 Tax=Paragonimus heterotremus TaxID=100268 RepID=A0A8J4SR58_9TREM|nr:hypothetical protein PHET_03057 [Paragonimus heterotremus]